MAGEEDPQAIDILSQQRTRWEAGDRIRVEQLVEEYPSLAVDSQGILDLIYAELVLREELGERPEASEYTSRFPNLTDQIERQFQVHRALDAVPIEAGSTVPPHGETVAISTEAGASILPGFEVIDVAGRGANGIVYKARDEQLGRTVAVKLLNMTTAEDDKRHNLFLRETEAVAKLHHPGIVQVFQVGAVQNRPFMVMEYVGEETLADQFKKGPMAPREAAELLIKVCDAVQHAHERGVIHRDIKPGNVLINNDGEPLVADFGLARRMDVEQSIHATGDVVGTPAYMSPEQARGEKAAEQSDVYSIGAVLYEALSGTAPFQATTVWEVLNRVLTHDPIPLAQLVPSVPRDLATICERCLDKASNRRYASAKEVSEELQRFIDGKPILARPVGRLQRFAKWCRRNPMIAGLTTAVAIALITTAVVAVQSQQRVSRALIDTQTALDDSEEKRELAVYVMNKMVIDVYEALMEREASLPARREVLQAAIEGLTEIVEAEGQRDDTRQTLSTAHERLGLVHSLEGNMEAAEKYALRSVELAEAMTNRGPDHDYAAEEQIARTTMNLCRFYSRAARVKEIPPRAKAVLKMIDRCLENDPESIELQALRVGPLERLLNSDYTTETMPYGEEAIAVAKRVLKIRPEDTTTKSLLQQTLINLGLKYAVISKIRKANELLSEGIQMLRDQKPDEIENPAIRGDYYNALHRLAATQVALGMHDPGIANYRESVDGLQRLLDSNDQRVSSRLKLAAAQQGAADGAYAMGLAEEAMAFSEAHIRNMTIVVESNAAYSVQKFSLAGGFMRQCNLYFEAGQPSEAVSMLEKSIEALEPLGEQFAEVKQQVASTRQLLELAKATAGLETAANETDIGLVMQSYAAWQDALHNEASIFADTHEELIADASKTKNPMTMMLLASFHARSYGKWYEQLVASDADPKLIAQVEADAINAVKGYAMVSGQPIVHNTEPEFAALRKSETFMAAFPIPE